MDTVLRLSNQLGDLGSTREQLERIMLDLEFGEELRSDVQLICEEVLANIITHGFEEMDGARTIELAFVFDGSSLTLSFEDDGKAFDPLAAADPDLDEEVDRPIGGLGIYLIKQLSTEQSYARQNGRNRLTVKRNLELENQGERP